ncbi:hypothetical protein PoB_005062600 [Plakobranchus ocellatus]|uniref:Uncharacterized protein n=1 Tax=Plakobranchus ocellatus TaxID=259542 RepID=A0AAV4BYD1_9GAST|nr:hypothetical protein PoB_005062600 [Plakobranchus ocellatus]
MLKIEKFTERAYVGGWRGRRSEIQDFRYLKESKGKRKFDRKRHLFNKIRENAKMEYGLKFVSIRIHPRAPKSTREHKRAPKSAREHQRAQKEPGSTGKR